MLYKMSKEGTADIIGTTLKGLGQTVIWIAIVALTILEIIIIYKMKTTRD